MAVPTITSYSPNTGPITGGTVCTVVGTLLTPVDTVLVGNNIATIIGTPTATGLVFATPVGDAAAAVKVTLLNSLTGEDAQAATSFTYTAVTSPEQLVTTLANKWRIDVNTGTFASPTWVKVRGITTAKAALAYSSEDDSDFDSGIWTSTLNTGIGWSQAFTVKRGRGISTGAYDPGQQFLLAASSVLGQLVDVRWYDRTAIVTTDEAYRGFAFVQWAPSGGNKTGDKVDVTLNGNGARNVIDNPVIADPTLKN